MWQQIFDAISAVFKQLMTGKDKDTHDIGRWSWFLSTATILFMSIWNVIREHTFPLWTITQCLVAIVVAHGVALFAKSGTEPPHYPPSVDRPC